jgi:phage terminase large subunit-like protein
MYEWDQCKSKIDKGKLLKRECYGALDLSSTTDLTAFALVFPPITAEELWKLLIKCYVPADTIVKRSKEDRVNYLMWRDAGYITETPGNVIDYAFIRKDVNNAAKIYNLIEVAHDPWGAVKLAVELQEEDGIEMVEHRQGYKSMSPPTKEAEKLILSKKIQHDGNPVLRWAMDNMVVTIDAAENVKPAKDKARERIDPMVASIMALGRAILHFDESSVYEDRGIIVL